MSEILRNVLLLGAFCHGTIGFMFYIHIINYLDMNDNLVEPSVKLVEVLEEITLLLLVTSE